MKDVSKRIVGITMFILIVASIPLLSITTFSTSLFKQATGILPSANALPQEMGDDAIDLPVTADSILGDIFNKKEIKELYGGQSPSPSSFFPSIDNEKIDTDQPSANLDRVTEQVIDLTTTLVRIQDILEYTFLLVDRVAFGNFGLGYPHHHFRSYHLLQAT